MYEFSFNFAETLNLLTMTKNFKAKKLRILVFLAGVAYFLMFINSFVEGWDDFKQGFADGWSNNHAAWGYSIFSVSSVDGVKFVPDTLVNKVNNQGASVISQTLNVRAPLTITGLSKVLFMLNMFVLMPVISIAIVLIPIYFFRILQLIERHLYFDDRCIHLLHKLGVATFVVYFGFILNGFFHFYIENHLFSFSDFKVNIPVIDNMWLMFGILAFIIAELLSKAKSLKEEQELTI